MNTVPKFKKLSPAQQRDFNCYQQLASSYKACQMLKPQHPHVAASLEEWYFLWDTHGIVAGYQDMQQAGRLTQAKDTLNLTIRLWIEDILQVSNTGSWPVLTCAEVWTYCSDYPAWVWKSFANQLQTHCLVFGFQKIQYAPDHKTFWPPELIPFDPQI